LVGLSLACLLSFLPAFYQSVMIPCSFSSSNSSHYDKILNALNERNFKAIQQKKQQQQKKRCSIFKIISLWWTLMICYIIIVQTTMSNCTMSFALGIVSKNNRLLRNSRRMGQSSTRLLLPRLHLENKKQSQDTSSLQSQPHNPIIQKIDFEKSGFSFELGGFDKQDQWMTIDPHEYHLPPPSFSSFSSSSDADADAPPSSQSNTPYYSIFQSDSDARIPVFSPLAPSPVELCLVRDRMVYIKRDDLLRLRKSNVSGNKARKMLVLNELPMDEFPDAIVSYGGPQSNAMVALAAIVNARNVELDASRSGDGDDEKGDEDEIQDNDFWFQDDVRLLDKENEDEDEDEDGDNYQNDEKDFNQSDTVPDEILQNDKGGTKANSSLASLAPKLERKKRFVYYTKKLPRYLRNQPNGNLLRALSLGMELVELSNEEYKRIFGGDNGGSVVAPEDIDPPVPYKSLWVPQGAACGLAIAGARLMAEEIVGFWSVKGNGMPLTVCLPGGTCTTALLLSREINGMVKERNEGLSEGDAMNKLDIVVSVIPCVGDEAYAERQMKALDLSTGGNGQDDMPLIFKPWKNSFPRFGEPSPHILKTFMEMKNDHGIFLDLLYGAAAWNTLLQYLTSQRESPIKGRQVMYVHSGGLEGVSSQLTRYRHKGLIDASHLQS
jgi:1-aminocyclopropane-1-carboxylate deaminase/D-cysteine desulfhydrase-like pyridoxal-dependent ACC family enzyme